MPKATFAAGCFWGVESSFQKVPGVTKTLVGYTGGTTANPTYKQVCSGTTGHAEAVRVEFNPDVISYAQLLEIFWSLHNPTTLNRQGPDVGSQYRSAIFFHGAEQEKEAYASKAAADNSGRYSSAVVTEIVPAAPFYPAEDYHQCYVQKREVK